MILPFKFWLEMEVWAKFPSVGGRPNAYFKGLHQLFKYDKISIV